MAQFEGVYNQEKEKETQVQKPTFLYEMDNIPFLEAYFNTLSDEAKRSFDENQEGLLDSQLILEDDKEFSQEFLEMKKGEPEQAEKLELSLAVLMREHGINPSDYPQYAELDPGERLNFIVSVARRDEFLQAITGLMGHADLYKNIKDLQEDHPTKLRFLKSVEQYGTIELEDFARIYNTEPSKFNLNFIRSRASTKEEVKKSRLALTATAHFNLQYPENNEDRQKALARLGFPQNLPSSVKSPKTSLTQEMYLPIAQIVSQTLNLQPA